MLFITLILLSVIYSKIDSKQGYKLGNNQRCQHPPCSKYPIISSQNCPLGLRCELTPDKNCTEYV
jgi:hypothetical protein